MVEESKEEVVEETDENKLSSIEFNRKVKGGGNVPLFQSFCVRRVSIMERTFNEKEEK